eukprot:NODE_29054_length_458_cov_1.126888.p2 GENE.NODE_29054_length_458_cov_1.126888~~NODE_29054_length_458_cov_1.126888.p2  ORF type:complete len:135 (-),score=48.31 NODE_29054_length_458_cov_1.126888:52-399(-)
MSPDFNIYAEPSMVPWPGNGNSYPYAAWAAPASYAFVPNQTSGVPPPPPPPPPPPIARKPYDALAFCQAVQTHSPSHQFMSGAKKKKKKKKKKSGVKQTIKKKKPNKPKKEEIFI